MVSGLEDEIGKESERDQVRKAIEGLKHKMMGRIDKTGRSLEVMKNTVTKQEEFNHRQEIFNERLMQSLNLQAQTFKKQTEQIL